MLDEIKKIQGINHNDFDTTINTWISAGKQDLIDVGILQTIVNSDPIPALIQTAIIQFVLSQIDVVNSEMYSNSYRLLKDQLKRISSYIEVSNGV